VSFTEQVTVRDPITDGPRPNRPIDTLVALGRDLCTHPAWRAARRCLLVGLAGSTAMAVAATGVGALPVDDALGTWPSFWSPGRPWAAVVLAYLGITLLLVAWWRLPAAVPRLRGRLAFVGSAAAVWAVPLLLAPPLYSRDIYSYLAQGRMYAEGLDPYRMGPAVLGGPFADNVSAMWQNTPAPYGPVFLGVASAVTRATGEHLVPAVIGMRLAMVLALLVTAACTVALARRCGVDPVRAVWLGAANPLVLAHVVSGAHNDVLIVMLMTAGLLMALRERPLPAAVLFGLGILVKAPTAAALLVVVPVMARRLHGRHRWLRAALLVGGSALATILAVTGLTGTWYGWVTALSDTARVRNGLSITTDLGVVGSRLLEILGWGGGLDLVSALRLAGLVAAGLLTCWVLLRYRDRPVYALGLILVGVVLLAPVVHPWYLLWGLVPLAASAREPKLQAALGLLSAGLAVYPMPWGEGFTSQLPLAVVGVLAGLIVAGAVEDRELTSSTMLSRRPSMPSAAERLEGLPPVLR